MSELTDLIRQVNTLRADFENLVKPEVLIAGIGARVYNDAALTITNNTTTILTFNSERYDTDDLHSTISNTGRLTAPEAGKYLITGHIGWVVAAVGRRQIAILLNGSTLLAVSEIGSIADATSQPFQVVTTIYELAATDYVELRVFQTSGGNLNVVAAGNYSPEFMMQILP